MKQKFFDNIESDWEDLVSDVYNNSSKRVDFIFNKNEPLLKFKKPSKSIYDIYMLIFIDKNSYPINTLSIKNLNNIYDIKNDDIDDRTDKIKIISFKTLFSNIIINGKYLYSQIIKEYFDNMGLVYPFKFYNNNIIKDIKCKNDIDNLEIKMYIECHFDYNNIINKRLLVDEIFNKFNLSIVDTSDSDINKLLNL